LVLRGEIFLKSFFDPNECGVSKSVERAMEKFHEELILLEPKPGAKGMDHDFKSPTFQERIQGHIKIHLGRKGIYTEKSK
jgi:hypothetical protein